MPWTTTDVFNVIHRTNVEHSPNLTEIRGMFQLILLTDYMSCFEMVEERPVTSGRLNLGAQEVVSSIQVRIDFAPDLRLLSIRLVEVFSGSIS